ncbi:phosphomevalonate kinase [Bifidobacterium aquikefiri]|uniref:phosphomevalonate kinase n=1 Tax=Bifidobacterium aquikefiri TaxID=1653207 RepID=UPI0039EA7FC4
MENRTKDDDLEETATGRAPGKLYVAGEYAVVEPGHRAIVVAVDRFLDVEVRVSHGDSSQGSLQSNRFTQQSVQWHRSQDTIVVDSADQSGWGFIINAIRMVEKLAREVGKTLKYCDISVSSGLDDASGKKYGLGSSAAVTVATVQALCSFYNLDIDAMQRYKLAFLAANEVQSSGSGGDIAAGTFHGCIAYSSPDRAWIAARNAESSLSIAQLIHMDWPGLSIEQLPIPTAMKFLVGWTGAPASTPELVANVQHRVHGNTKHQLHAQSGTVVSKTVVSEPVVSKTVKAHEPSAHAEQRYAAFIQRSDACVQSMAEAFGHGDISAIQTQIREARRILLSLTEITGTVVETPALHRLVSIAESHGAAAKSSGAGGGDCGIAICGMDVDARAIQHDWNACGIEALNLRISMGDE